MKTQRLKQRRRLLSLKRPELFSCRTIKSLTLEIWLWSWMMWCGTTINYSGLIYLTTIWLLLTKTWLGNSLCSSLSTFMATTWWTWLWSPSSEISNTFRLWLYTATLSNILRTTDLLYLTFSIRPYKTYVSSIRFWSQGLSTTTSALSASWALLSP